MSVPTITNLLELWRDTLVADSAISTFCTTNFSTACTFYVGMDIKNLPGEANAPFLILQPQTQIDGQSDPTLVWAIDIFLGVSSSIFADYQSKGANEMKAIYLLDEFKGLVMTALEALAASRNLVTDSVSFTFDTDTFPLVVGTLSIESRYTNTIGASFSL